MTEFIVVELVDGKWLVQSTDWRGRVHETEFRGPLAKERAEVYAAFMNERNRFPVVMPDE